MLTVRGEPTVAPLRRSAPCTQPTMDEVLAMEETRSRRRAAAVCAALVGFAVGLGLTPAVRAAERTVLCEEFTNRFCSSCAHAGPALSEMVDVFEDSSFAFIQYQIFDFAYTTPWVDERWAFYEAEFTPSTIFDGIDRIEGAVDDEAQQYTIYRTLHFLPDRDIPTDVTIIVGADDLGGQTYRVHAEVGIEAGGVGKTLRIYMVQVLDHWPTFKPYHRNGFKQEAPTQDITLVPGTSQVVTYDFTFDDDSWASPDDIKIIVWAQEPRTTWPAEVYQAAVRRWPLISYPGDQDGDGYLDGADNCPQRYNPDQTDSDGDGIGDACDNCDDAQNPLQTDTDEDTFGNTCDNCPALHALDQSDDDLDSVGNPCDSCPDVPAPAGVNAFGRSLGCIDLDCDVDADDFALLAGCLSGPDVSASSGCNSSFVGADFDHDGDLDLRDLYGFQANFTGPLVSPPIYVGADNCIACHTDQHTAWATTIHANAFNTLVVDGNGDNVLCFPCHAVGYGKPSGFVDLQTTPQLANIQCENCHGPGSNHVADPNNVQLSVLMSSDTCGACHQSCHGLCGENHHPQYEQWKLSQHALALENMRWDPNAVDACLRCHSTDYRLAPPDAKPTLDNVEFAIECVACHNPHGSANVGQLRLPPHLLCSDCHTMEGAVPGETPPQTQAEMLHSLGGYKLNGQPLVGPYTQHWSGIADECVTCHVHFEPYGGPQQPVNSGHTFVANLRACLPCHTEAVATQLVADLHTEVELRLAIIAHFFTPGDPLYINPASLPPPEQARYAIAKFNYDMVAADRSYGTHNAPYTRTLLSQTETFLGIPPWLWMQMLRSGPDSTIGVGAERAQASLYVPPSIGERLEVQP